LDVKRTVQIPLQMSRLAVSGHTTPSGRLTGTTSRHYDQTASQYPVDLSNPTPGFG